MNYSLLIIGDSKVDGDGSEVDRDGMVGAHRSSDRCGSPMVEWRLQGRSSTSSIAWEAMKLVKDRRRRSRCGLWLSSGEADL
jgi:hypothetical protein